MGIDPGCACGPDSALASMAWIGPGCGAGCVGALLITCPIRDEPKPESGALAHGGAMPPWNASIRGFEPVPPLDTCGGGGAGLRKSGRLFIVLPISGEALPSNGALAHGVPRLPRIEFSRLISDGSSLGVWSLALNHGAFRYCEFAIYVSLLFCMLPTALDHAWFPFKI